MRRWRNFGALLGLAATLSACGGGGGSNPAPPTQSPSPPASGNDATCALSARQSWAQGVLNEWYLYPETLPGSIDAGAYQTVPAFIDALTATARSQGRDRFFTYLTSIREEEAFYSRGASAGFGFRLQTDGVQRRAFVAEAFEGAPSFAAGMDRGDEIVAIGEVPGNLRLVSDIIAADARAACRARWGRARLA